MNLSELKIVDDVCEVSIKNLRLQSASSKEEQMAIMNEIELWRRRRELNWQKMQRLVKQEFPDELN